MIGTLDLDLVDGAEALFPEELVVIESGPSVTSVVVMTASSSGYAFSVNNARGRLSSPRGQRASVQNVRMCAMRGGDLVAGSSASPNAGISAVEAAHGPAAMRDRGPVGIGLARREVAVGEVGQRQRRTRADSTLRPRPSPPWHAAQAAV